MKAGTYREARRAFEPLHEPLKKFANPDVVCQGWYAVGRSAEFKRGAVKSQWIGTRDVVLYRNLSGAMQAVERSCPHLGADLARARVVEKGLQCAFHGWCWGPDGTCGSRRIRTYATRERWGIVWVWAGDVPGYDLPEPKSSNVILRLPEQRIDCHPHVILGNGLDFSHVGGVHRFHLLGDPSVDVDAPRLAVDIHGRFGFTLMRKLLLLSGCAARWRFTTIGPSLAWLSVESPTRFELVWACRPLPDGGSATQTVFFLPGYRALLRALPMMIATTRSDRRILEGLRFRQGFVESDAVFHLYARLVEEIPEWIA